MNKRTRIGLTVLLTVVLIMTTALPVLANTHSTFFVLNWLAYDKQGDSINVDIPSDATWSLNGDVFTVTATGNIPLGESPFSPWVTYYDLDDMREYLCDTYGGDACSIDTPFTIGPDEMGDAQMYRVYKGVSIESDNWRLKVWESGKFEIWAEFTIE